MNNPTDSDPELTVTQNTGQGKSLICLMIS